MANTTKAGARERRLWACVLWQWGNDLKLCIRHQKNDILRHLLKWQHTHDFNLVCSWAGTSAESVQYETKQLLKRHGLQAMGENGQT